MGQRAPRWGVELVNKAVSVQIPHTKPRNPIRLRGTRPGHDRKVSVARLNDSPQASRTRPSQNELAPLLPPLILPPQLGSHQLTVANKDQAYTVLHGESLGVC